MAEGKGREIPKVSRFDEPLTGSDMEGPGEASSSPNHTASKKLGTSILQVQRTGFFQKPV